jgi:subtilisin family serine protease
MNHRTAWIVLVSSLMLVACPGQPGPTGFGAVGDLWADDGGVKTARVRVCESGEFKFQPKPEYQDKIKRYRFDFNDGSGSLETTTGRVLHVYHQPQGYLVKLDALDAQGKVIVSGTQGFQAERLERDCRSEGKNNYIVRLTVPDAELQSKSEEIVKAVGGTLLSVYTNTLKGFAATLTLRQVSEIGLRAEVSRMEFSSAFNAQVGTSSGTAPGSVNAWGLAAIGKPQQPNNGSGVHVFVVDSGIDPSHPDLAGKVMPGRNFTPDAQGKVDPNNTQDCFWHGTHVAGIVAGSQYGVAPGVKLYPVRVLGCDQNSRATPESLIAALDWVTGEVVKGGKKPAVVNMSLIGAVSPYLEDAIEQSTLAGITYVVSAGNAGSNACNFSPSKLGNELSGVITVGASDQNNTIFSNSNNGACVNVFAPGAGILSTVPNAQSANGYGLASGTSMAAPFVTAAAAIYLSRYPSAQPLEVKNALIGSSIGDITGARVDQGLLNLRPITVKLTADNTTLTLPGAQARLTATIKTGGKDPLNPDLIWAPLNQVGGSGVERIFTPLTPGAYTFTVTSQIDPSAQAQVNITVNPALTPPPPQPKPPQDVRFNTRAYFPVGGQMLESITAYGMYWNYVNGALQASGNLHDVGPYGQPGGPCDGLPRCTFETRDNAPYESPYVDTITARGWYWTYWQSKPMSSGTLTSVPRYMTAGGLPGPCYGTTGANCTFNTRTFVWVGDQLVESIYAYGKIYNYNNNQQPMWPQYFGQKLQDVDRYKIICQAATTCVFDTRTFYTAANGQELESITAYGRIWEFDKNNGALVTDINRNNLAERYPDIANYCLSTRECTRP